MRNADMPAMPVCFEHENGDITAECYGLTKREHFAAMAMQATLSSNPPMDVEHNEMAAYMEVVVEYAAMAADALLAELERTQ